MSQDNDVVFIPLQSVQFRENQIYYGLEAPKPISVLFIKMASPRQNLRKYRTKANLKILKVTCTGKLNISDVILLLL